MVIPQYLVIYSTAQLQRLTCTNAVCTCIIIILAKEHSIVSRHTHTTSSFFQPFTEAMYMYIYVVYTFNGFYVYACSLLFYYSSSLGYTFMIVYCA